MGPVIEFHAVEPVGSDRIHAVEYGHERMNAVTTNGNLTVRSDSMLQIGVSWYHWGENGGPERREAVPVSGFGLRAFPPRWAGVS
jgi:hypothetical protein